MESNIEFESEYMNQFFDRYEEGLTKIAETEQCECVEEYIGILIKELQYYELSDEDINSIIVRTIEGKEKLEGL